MADTLEQVLADARGEAAVLRRAGNAGQADYVEELCSRVQAAAEDYLTFISEDDARLQSGKSVAWLRARHAEWMDSGNAQLRGRKRYYRACVIPRRPDLIAAREAGRHGGASNAA